MRENTGMKSLKLSIRKKIILLFTVFILVGGAIWFLNYYKHDLLNKKLQLIEKKDVILNTILEARRYEKNYFLSLDEANLKNALFYIQQAEKRLQDIISSNSPYISAEALLESRQELKMYGEALSKLLSFYHQEGSLRLDERLVKDFPKHQKEVTALGRKITSSVEQMVRQERKIVNRLLKDSRRYHLLALCGLITLSIGAVLFLFFNINKPLKSIEEAIHKIAMGDYTNIPSVWTDDEFASLVSSLNDMINELNRRNEQLIQAKKLASLGTLTSGVAHELNNPLNNISTSVQILLEELDDGDREYKKELLLETERQVERARDIVKALLEFSRERSFCLKRVRLKDVVDDTIRLIRGELPADVELQVEVPEEITGDMDPRRIQQVLLNLILNGIQAMEGSGVLKIAATQDEEAGEFCFMVQDTGKGIPEEILPKIFDPFFTTKDGGGDGGPGHAEYHGIIEQPGSGLGLSICHSIVEKHGGRIEVESKPGEGATFTIHLPLKGIDHGPAESDDPGC